MRRRISGEFPFPFPFAGASRFLRGVAVAGAFGVAAVLPAAAVFADDGSPVFGNGIRPILSGKCFKCHGRDAEAREADLRLDVREAAIDLEAIVPGSPEHILKLYGLDRPGAHDFHATCLHLLGIDHEQLTHRHQGRDFRLTDVHGKVVDEILA